MSGIIRAMASTEEKRTCPICERPVPPRTEGSGFPFCSPRCQLADLGKWIDGGYAIPGEPAPELDD